MDLQLWIMINTASVIGLIYLFVFLYTNTSMEKKLKYNFYWIIGLELLELIFYNCELVTAGLPYPTMHRILLSALGYTIRPVLALMVLWSTMQREIGRKRGILLLIPLCLNALIAFSAFFTDIAYSYSPDNRFIRGPLGYSSQIITFFYLLLVIVSAIRNAKENPVMESAILISTMTLIIISMVLEAVFKVRFTGRAVIVLSTIFYYMYYQTQEYKEHMQEGQRLRTKLEKKSQMDGLTGLLNKEAFKRAAENELSSSEDVNTALVFFDMDNFKQVNDTYGHVAGDRLLKKVADRMKNTFRQEDLLGRFGGDEFYVLMRGITSQNLNRRLQLLIEDMHLEGEDGSLVTASVGCAFLAGGRQADVEELIRIADEALYEAKEKGRNRYVIREVKTKKTDKQ